ncbi:spore coat U domain-containing protein [Yokenella regensburgei]|uniref:spore coat protein U domain-containing protein n=1 Tax=Yokenella regensburgei TaxID=158877 RepID=UPI003F14CBEC
MKKYLLLSTLLAALPVPLTFAAVSSGTIGVSLTLTNGCLINGTSNQNGINFGSLNFGDSPTSFSQLSTQLAGSGKAANAIGVQCTTDSYAVVITGNTNTVPPATTIGVPGGTARYLMSATNRTQGVAYRLYSDGNFSSEVGNNMPLPRASTADGVDYYTLYGRILAEGNNAAVIPGIYTDTLNVSVIY